MHANAARSAADELVGLTEATQTEARSAADRAGLTGLHDRLTDGELQQARQVLRATVDAQRQRISEVRGALAAYASAVGRHDNAGEDRAANAAELDTAIDEKGAVQEDYDAELDRLTAQLDSWLDSWVELSTVDRQHLATAAASEVAVLDLVGTARTTVETVYTRRETELGTASSGLADERSRLTAERDRLRGTADLPPPIPHTRTTDRSTMDGAPDSPRR